MESHQDDIGSRLASAWLAGRIHEACGILIDEVQSRCVKSLLFKYGNKLSYEDCEDCFDSGVSKLLVHSKTPEQVRNPYNYVWTCAINEANDMLREHKQIVHFDPEWLGSAEDEAVYEGVSPPVPNRWRLDSALVIAEVTLDAEVSDSSFGETIKEVLGLAVGWLVPRRQRLIGLLLECGADIPNELLAELMGMSDGAVRSLKCRAFEDLRTLVPRAAKELGVDVTDFLAPEPEVLSDMPPSLPSLDEDVDLIPPVT